MKKRSLLLVVFMLALFAIPAFHRTASLTEGPNKAYYTSDAWEEIGNATVGFQTPDWKQAGGNASLGFQTPSEPSPQSLSNFSETISDDVLYYPDMYVQEATYGNVSGAETNDYTYMLEDDASYWQNAHGGSDGYSYIDVEGPILAESVNVTINALASGPIATHTVYLYLVNPSGADLLLCQDTGVGAGDAEIDGTYTISNWMSYEDNGNHTFYLKSLQGGANPVSLLGDYFHVGPVVGYAESFSDVSEWQLEFESAGLPSKSFTSDGDVTTLEIGFDDAGNEYARYNVSLTGLAVTDYIEFRFISSVTAGSYRSSALTVLLNDVQICREYSSTWKTMKFYIGDYIDVAPTTLAIQVDDYANPHASDTGYIKLDFARIGPADKMGWQYDGSFNTTGPITFGTNMTAVTDGDKLTATQSADAQAAHFFFNRVDGTQTKAMGDYDHYQFIEWSITSIIDGDADNKVWLARVYDSDNDYVNLPPSETIYTAQTGVFRASLKATVLDDFYYFKLYLEDTLDSWTLDYVKLYSIANFTVTETSTTIDDYLYTEDGVLHAVIDSGEIVIDRDPALNITTPYHSWEINATAGNPQTSVYVGTWSDYTSNTTGRFLYNETLSDIRLKFTDNTDLVSITFAFALMWVELPVAYLLFRGAMWNDIVSAIIHFINFFEQDIIQWYLSIIGCVLIPLSTVVLAKGSKDDMSRDKLFLFLIIFFIGWGLLLGGLA